MSNGKKILIGMLLVTLAFVGGVFSWGVSTSNNLVELEADVDGKWAQVENSLQRRYDLIPNLVGAVEGSMNQEKEIFTAIADARRTVSSASSVEEVAEGNEQLNDGLKVLMNVIHESYPELASNDNVKDLMSQLEGSENRIATERQKFNESVTAYNVTIRKFPTTIIASITGFEKRDLFEMAEGAEIAPTVQFNNGGE